MDGMGDFSRFPIKQRRMEEFGYRKVFYKDKKTNARKKKKTVRGQLVDVRKSK